MISQIFMIPQLSADFKGISQKKQRVSEDPPPGKSAKKWNKCLLFAEQCGIIPLETAAAEGAAATRTEIRGKDGVRMQELSKMQQRIYDYIAGCIRDQGYPPLRAGDRRGRGAEVSLHGPLPPQASGGGRGHRKGRRQGPGHHPAGDGPGRRTRCLWWAAWPPEAPFWRRSAIEDYLTFDTGGRPGSILPCGSGESPCSTPASCRAIWLVVHRQPTARHGEIVVALIGDEGHGQAPVSKGRGGVAAAGE